MSLEQRLNKVRHRIANCAHSCGRPPADVRLVAVSKRHPASAIAELYAKGQRDFGENYLQEALEKQQTLTSLDIVWHFIGPIQSNKTRTIAENFAWVHTLDRLKIAQRLSQQRPANMPPLNVCIQVNIDDEATKAGISAAQCLSLVDSIKDLPHLLLRGLMAIPSEVTALQPHAFARMNALFNELKAARNLPFWDTLSMGMSADLEQAIANGANIVRIGTDIFGPRDQ